MAACAAAIVLNPCAAALYWLFYNEFRVGLPRAVDMQRKSNVARMDLTGAARRKSSSAIRWQVERLGRTYRTVGHALESDGGCIRHGCDARLRALHHKSRENGA
jgi:hypothetical protein